MEEDNEGYGSVCLSHRLADCDGIRKPRVSISFYGKGK